MAQRDAHRMSTAQLWNVLVAAAIGMVAGNLAVGALWLRYLFNRWVVTKWLAEGLRASAHGTPREKIFQLPWNTLCDRERQALRRLTATSLALKADLSRPSLERELAQLAVGSRRLSLYRVDVDHMAAQINAAAETALDHPRHHALLLSSLSAISLSDTGDPEKTERTDGHVLHRYVQIQSFRAELEAANKLEGKKEARQTELVDMRSTITNLIQRRIDDVQISARSRSQIRDLTMYIAVAIGTSLLLGHGSTRDRITMGVAAGFLAPLMQDLRMFLRQPR